MAYETFYEGTTYGMEPGSDSLYTGATMAQGALGATTGVQTANQLQDVGNFLNQGMKTIEVSTISPEVFDMIPKQHMKEMDRLSKLTNFDITLHAPIIEPSGFTQQGWNEQNREAAERQLKDVILRAHDMSPGKAMPVTIHASAIPGTERMPIDIIGKKNLTADELRIYEKEGSIPTQMIAVNQETGDLVPLRREVRHYPTSPKGKVYAPMEEIAIANRSYWDNKLSQLVFYKERGDDILTKNFPMVAAEYKAIANGEIPQNKIGEILTDNQKAAFSNVTNANIYLENTHQSLNSLFNEAYKVANGKGKEALEQASEQFKQALEEGHSNPTKYSAALQGIIRAMQHITVNGQGAGIRADIYKPVEEFAVDKASKTFGNVAYEAWKKFGNSAPIISIENPPYGTALSTAEDLKKLIKRSRAEFVEKAVSKGMSEGDAKRAAESMIGATWDTSHISMMRKQGFDKKELIKEAGKIAPMVKHVHLNDNFGHSHTDLPPGMGNVPIGDIMKKLKAEGYKGKAIFEGGNFFQHFKTPPHGMLLEAMGSAIYSAQAQPSWTKVYGTMGNYSSGYGTFLPEQNFSMYGSGFSGLPPELGGQVSGRQSRFSGTSMS